MLTVAPPASLLLDPARHALQPSTAALELRKVVVIAPHPDDESLGCGGLLALLAAGGRQPQVVVMTDGSRSHPGSQSHPAARLAAVRESETLAALAELGLPPESAHFLRFRDGGLPAAETPAFAEAVAQIQQRLDALAPDTLLVPWRRDPHGDHEATWRLWRAAVTTGEYAPLRWLEYPVWAWTQAGTACAPQAEEARAWRLDISTVAARKHRAIVQHRSQLGGLIHDDPGGFVLEPSMLAHFAEAWELFLEPHGG